MKLQQITNEFPTEMRTCHDCHGVGEWLHEFAEHSASEFPSEEYKLCETCQGEGVIEVEIDPEDMEDSSHD